jgi:hypothetical protein
MYAGTTFRKDSGSIVGVHQKIDRVARRLLKKRLTRTTNFPTINQILHFEGNNGPDAIKRKSPSKDEPWHYINPAKPEDRALIGLINDHIYNLTEALRYNNEQRAAFEAAWMAHAVVDGLTPAHHYPLNDKIEELWGKPHQERLTIADKNIIRGNGGLDTISKNWQYWGVGGVFSAHLSFELGIASTIATQKFSDIDPTPAEFRLVEKEGFEAVFTKMLYKIDAMKMYDEFGEGGWTHSLAVETRDALIPEIIRTVCLAWYYAAYLTGDKNL